ncbi:hypothetical protein B0H17DRAFT_1162508 [Mycena rosella]|uniref:Uncharacterized protein n=1 Tax=Mycena rosella TaxID=1033263 RepID=A0AAD7CWH6_MYCRO|nr:hypothetical protein B0H17DRAFT_1162508 [Mycena rosella]
MVSALLLALSIGLSARQAGTNQCGTELNQASNCQNAYSVCSAGLMISPTPRIRIEMAWCLKNGTGARLIPDGAITDYVQVTGIGNMSLLNIPSDDDPGGELDPQGNPIGGLVFSTAFGNLEQVFEWTGSNAPGYCQHIYGTLGCAWNMPGSYANGFDSCHADSGEVYGSSTFFQGQTVTPDAHPAPSPTSCTTGTNIITSSVSPLLTLWPPFMLLTVIQAQPTGSGSGSVSRSTTLSTGSNSKGAPSLTTSLAASIQGWARLPTGVGSAVVFSLVGAVIVL